VRAAFGFSANIVLITAATVLPIGQLPRSWAVRLFSLRDWCRRAARDAGELLGPTSEEKARIKALERENRELRQANEILKKASAYFAAAELDRPFRK
jgi:transposase-like protein